MFRFNTNDANLTNNFLHSSSVSNGACVVKKIISPNKVSFILSQFGERVLIEASTVESVGGTKRYLEGKVALKLPNIKDGCRLYSIRLMNGKMVYFFRSMHRSLVMLYV